MLKITVDQAPAKITLKLEGSLSGAWVSELEDSLARRSSRRNRPRCLRRPCRRISGLTLPADTCCC